MPIGDVLEDLAAIIDVPEGINQNLTCPTPDFLAALLGLPRSNFTDTCQPVTNRNLAIHMKTKNIGPFIVTGLCPAVESLTRIMSQVKSEHPEVYSKLGTVGMLGCRYISSRRSKVRKISSHSWGTAIDLTVANILDSRGDGKSQYGLALISSIFNRNGWYWGAGFRYEDSMHFEVSREKLEEWKRRGELGTITRSVAAVSETKLKLDNGSSTPVFLQIGARGPAVRALQMKMKQKGYRVEIDAIFGLGTENAVKDFQRNHSLRADGIVGPKTIKVLGWR